MSIDDLTEEETEEILSQPHKIKIPKQREPLKESLFNRFKVYIISYFRKVPPMPPPEPSLPVPIRLLNYQDYSEPQPSYSANGGSRKE